MSTITAAENMAAAIETVESHLHPTPSWDVADHPMPNGREEIWRFTPIRRFKALLDAPAEATSLNWSGERPSSVTLDVISAEDARALSVEAPVDRVAALAAEAAPAPVHINIAADTELAEPVVFTGHGEGGQGRDHIVLTVGRNSSATVVFRFEGTSSYAEKTDVIVGDGATLNLVFVQDWADGAIHGGQRTVQVGRDAHVKMVSTSMGGDVIRLQENSKFSGPGGELEQFGLYFVDGGQHIQHRLFVDHSAPHTKSNVDYRGALQGKGANSVWIGDVLIRKVATDIDTYESNKNLILTEGCQADSVPNLEIETGDIAGAGHSSTTGRFDDEQLFYLRSRGISEEEARRLVVHGFFHDIIRRIQVPSIEARLLEQVERELELSAQAQAGKS